MEKKRLLRLSRSFSGRFIVSITRLRIWSFVLDLPGGSGRSRGWVRSVSACEKLFLCFRTGFELRCRPIGYQKRSVIHEFSRYSA